MKRKLVFIFFMFSTVVLFAQKQKVNHMTTFDDKLIHFGFTLGLNTMDMAVVHFKTLGDNPEFSPQPNIFWFPEERGGVNGSEELRADIAEVIPGFTVGIVSSLRLSRDLNLRFLPGLSFGERQLVFNKKVVEQNSLSFQTANNSYSIKSTYLDFPLLIKYKARRINNNRPYIIFGTAYRQDISRTGKDDLVKLNNGGFYAEVGGGWDHYFTFFRFSVEAKFSFGLNNQLGPPPGPNQRQYYSQAFKSLRSNIFTLCFHFE